MLFPVIPSKHCINAINMFCVHWVHIVIYIMYVTEKKLENRIQRCMIQ